MQITDKILSYEIRSGMPLDYYPNEMPHGNATNDWYNWENYRFEEHWRECIVYWQRIMAFVGREEKENNIHHIVPANMVFVVIQKDSNMLVKNINKIIHHQNLH